MAKVWGFLLYKLFLFISRRVSFTDFNRIWNEAYQAHVEAEWVKMKRIASSPTSSMSTKLPQDGLEAGVGVSARGRPFAQTWPPQDSKDGLEEKPLLSHSQE